MSDEPPAPEPDTSKENEAEQKPEAPQAPPDEPSSLMPGESVEPSRQTMNFSNEEKLSKGKRLAYFVYDPNSGYVLGRPGISWLRITVFYIIFYFFVATFFILWLFIMIACMGKNKPLNSGDDYPQILIGATGLTVVPLSKLENSDGNRYSRISYSMKNEAAIKDLQDNLSKTIKRLNRSTTTVPPQCSEENGYGYKEGKPCVLFRFNRVFGWVPEPMIKLENYLKKYYSPTTPHYRDFIEYKKNNPQSYERLKADHIGFTCISEEPKARSYVGKIEYYPDAGFRVSDLKPPKNSGTKDKWDWTPYIFAKFLNPRKNVAIQIVCKAFEKNMDLYYAKQGVGAARFELKIVNK